MRKLAAVEDARSIMVEGMHWSVWSWLLEKPRVRTLADQATAALDNADKKVKSSWPADLKMAYSELVAQEKSKSKGNARPNAMQEKLTIRPEVMRLAKRVKEVDDRAERARLDAEDIFDEAERRFSADMAREGARKALESYDLREAAIRKAEAAARQYQSLGVPVQTSFDREPISASSSRITNNS